MRHCQRSRRAILQGMRKQAVKMFRAFALTGALLMAFPAHTGAQVQMPDPAQMSGVPLPSPELAPGTITVRVVRGAVSNIIPNQPVELRVGGIARNANTDASGRATFSGLRAGEQVQASTVVDGARLESQVITMPAQGGIRVMLV